MSSARATGPDLTGRRIMIVEDVYLLASDLAVALARRGAEIVGPCRSAAEARELLPTTGADFVVLDVRLGDETCFALADELKARGVPFVLASGYDRAFLPERWASAPHLPKPVDLAILAEAVSCLLQSR